MGNSIKKTIDHYQVSLEFADEIQTSLQSMLIPKIVNKSADSVFKSQNA